MQVFSSAFQQTLSFLEITVKKIAALTNQPVSEVFQWLSYLQIDSLSLQLLQFNASVAIMTLQIYCSRSSRSVSIEREVTQQASQKTQSTVFLMDVLLFIVSSAMLEMKLCSCDI